MDRAIAVGIATACERPIPKSARRKTRTGRYKWAAGEGESIVAVWDGYYDSEKGWPKKT